MKRVRLTETFVSYGVTPWQDIAGHTSPRPLFFMVRYGMYTRTMTSRGFPGVHTASDLCERPRSKDRRRFRPASMLVESRSSTVIFSDIGHMVQHRIDGFVKSLRHRKKIQYVLLLKQLARKEQHAVCFHSCLVRYMNFVWRLR